AEKEGGDRFFTDFRYDAQSAAQVGAAFVREISSGNLLDAAARALADLGSAGGGGRLGLDEETITVADHTRLSGKLPEGWELVPCTGAVRALRAVKDEGEVSRIRAACELADEALSSVLEDGLAGRGEREV